MNMTSYQPFAMTNPNNPYTEESFRQNARNKFAQLQQTLLSASAPVSAPSNGKAPSGNYSAYGAGYDSFQKNLGVALSQSGFSPDWVGPLTELVKKESSFNPAAKNPKSTAYGYGQFLASTRANYEKKLGLSYDNPVNQLVMMMNYIKDRYGNAQNALNFHLKNNWY